MIFVFGSNLDGNHAGGAARYAHLNHSAKMGVGEGPTGNTYALPTVSHDFARMDLTQVAVHVQRFIEYATNHPELTFQVTCVGCGLAGLRNCDIAPMFADAPANCLFDQAWTEWLPNAHFLGTF